MTKLVDAEGQEFELISVYSLEQAIADGVLVEVWKEQWSVMSSGLPIVATAAVVESYDDETLKALWSLYVSWRIYVMPTLPEEEQMFSTEIEGKTVWIIEDGTAVTVLFNTDY